MTPSTAHPRRSALGWIWLKRSVFFIALLGLLSWIGLSYSQLQSRQVDANDMADMLTSAQQRYDELVQEDNRFQELKTETSQGLKYLKDYLNWCRQASDLPPNTQHLYYHFMRTQHQTGKAFAYLSTPHQGTLFLEAAQVPVDSPSHLSTHDFSAATVVRIPVQQSNYLLTVINKPGENIHLLVDGGVGNPERWELDIRGFEERGSSHAADDKGLDPGGAFWSEANYPDILRISWRDQETECRFRLRYEAETSVPDGKP